MGPSHAAWELDFFVFIAFTPARAKPPERFFTTTFFSKKIVLSCCMACTFPKSRFTTFSQKNINISFFLLTSNAKRSFFVVSNHDFSTFGPLSEKATCHFHSRGVEKMKKAVSALGGKHFFLSLPCSMGMPFLFFSTPLQPKCLFFVFFPTPLQPKCFFLSFSCRVRDACFGFFNTSAAKMLVLFFTTPLQPKCMFLLILQQFLIILDVF